MPGVRCFPLMGRTYYIFRYRLDGADSYLIWYTNEEDGVFVDEAGVVPSFKDTDALLKYAGGRGISLVPEEPKLQNLDVLERWLKEGDDGLIAPDSFNDAWNLFADVSRSIGGGFDTDRGLTQKIYEKLFWGCNLPVVTPEGKRYDPVWTERELKVMREVLGSGMEMFRRSVRGA
jgi:hypothetical protein